MKKITLKLNGTFEHQWLDAIHGKVVPASAINVTDDVFMALSQNSETKRYDLATKTVIDYLPPFDAVAALNAKRVEINVGSTQALNSIIRQYTREEIDSWPVQESEAKSWAVDNMADTPLIDSMVANRPSVDKPELVSRILENAVIYKAFSGVVIGKKQAFEDQLNSLDPATATQDDIDAIEVVY